VVVVLVPPVFVLVVVAVLAPAMFPEAPATVVVAAATQDLQVYQVVVAGVVAPPWSC
jgi:hypothetical protein